MNDDDRRRRRRVLLGGAIAFIGLFAVGAAVMVPWVEDDLTERVEDAAAAAGMPDVSADFSGQDGTLTCAEPAEDPAALEDLAEDVWGVHDIDLGSCAARAASPAAPTTTVAGTAEAATTSSVASELTSTTSVAVSQLQVDVTRAEGDPASVVARGTVDTDRQRGDLIAELESIFGAGNVTDDLEVADVEGTDSDELVASIAALAGGLRDDVIEGAAGYDGAALFFRGTAVDAAAEARVRSMAEAAGVDSANLELSVAEPTGLDASASLAAGSAQVTLTGTVETAAQHDQLVAAAGSAFGAENVVDELTVADVATPVNDAEAATLAGLVGVLTPNLTEGSVTFDGDAFALSGTYVSEESRAVVEQAAAAAGIDAAAITLTPRPAATADEAAQLEQELNATVGLTPIPFDAGSATLRPEAAPILDQVAALARTYAGVVISVDGHTDADGSESGNLALSQARADAVLQALVERGTPAEQLVAQGFGESQPVAPNDTPENKALNRRVVFSVVPQ